MGLRKNEGLILLFLSSIVFIIVNNANSLCSQSKILENQSLEKTVVSTKTGFIEPISAYNVSDSKYNFPLEYRNKQYLWRAGCAETDSSSTLQKLLLLIKSSKTFHILVLGGSETAGVSCEEGDITLKECAWSARFVSYLRSQFSDVNFVLLNVAVGGTTISVALPSISQWLGLVDEPALVLIDFIVNDTFDYQDSKISNNILASYEQVIQTMKRLRPEFIHMFINACGLPRCHYFNNIIKTLATFRNIPVVSYYDMVEIFHGIYGDPVWDSFFGIKGPHPRWEVHQLIADLAWKCLQWNWSNNQRKFAEGNAIVASDKEMIDRLRMCDVPTSVFNSLNASCDSLIQKNGWNLYEDRPGKPGWITEKNKGGTISFNINFGLYPRLTVVYLRSYENLGKASLSFSDILEKEVILDGLYSSISPKISQAFLLTMEVSRENCWQPELGLSGCLGFGIQPYSSHILEIRMLDEQKFKLLSVTAC